MKRPIPGSRFPKWSMRAMRDEGARRRNRRDGDEACPVEVERWKARVGSVGGKLGARRWHLLTLRSGAGNQEKRRRMEQWTDSHQMEEVGLAVACRWARNEAAQGWLC
jgi:hypothetical protein